MRLLIQHDMVYLSRQLWSLAAPLYLRKFVPPAKIVLVGEATDEELEAARRAWPIAERFRRREWPSPLTVNDAIMATRDRAPPTHRGPKILIDLDPGEDPWG